MPRQATVPKLNCRTLDHIDLDKDLTKFGFSYNIELGAYEKDFFSEDGYLSSYILVVPYDDVTEVWVESNDGRRLDQAMTCMFQMQEAGLVRFDVR